MSRKRIWVLAIAGLLLPVALAMGTYLISSGLDASASSPPVVKQDRQITSDARHSGTLRDDERGPSPSPSATDDHSGRCSEPEHLNDPSCTGASPSSGPAPTPTTDHSGSDSSGKGSGGSGGGKGSDDSGR